MPASKRPLEQFLATWDFEAQRTVRLLEVLPTESYDYRPDGSGRSLGELSWHLAEIEAYMTWGVETRSFEYGMKPPGVERPREVALLAPGYRRVHGEAVARVRQLKPADLDRRIKFFSGTMKTISEILWGAVLHHHIHHRGQLTLMCRLAGGKPPGLYGPTREEMAAMRSAAAPRS